MMNLKPKINKIIRKIDSKSPSILTGFGITGVFTTTILAIRATPAAYTLIAEEYLARHEDTLERIKADPNYSYLDEDLTLLEKVKLTLPCYAPTIISGSLTVICIFAANKINLQRNAALFGLYSVTNEALSRYQEKVIETIGKRKEEKIHEEMAQDRLDENPIEENSVYVTGHGDHLFFDTLSGRYFKSDIETVRKIQNDFNEELLTDMYKPVNEFYYMLGLEPIEMGRAAGWDVDMGKLDIRFSAKIASNGEPAIVLDYSIYPKNL